VKTNPKASPVASTSLCDQRRPCRRGTSAGKKSFFFLFLSFPGRSLLIQLRENLFLCLDELPPVTSAKYERCARSKAHSKPQPNSGSGIKPERRPFVGGPRSTSPTSRRSGRFAHAPKRNRTRLVPTLGFETDFRRRPKIAPERRPLRISRGNLRVSPGAPDELAVYSTNPHTLPSPRMPNPSRGEPSNRGFRFGTPRSRRARNSLRANPT